MAWLFILLGLALVLGPVLYLMPTRRDKEQAMLRGCARAAGLVVELTTLHKVDSEAHERVSASAQPRQMAKAAACPARDDLHRARHIKPFDRQINMRFLVTRINRHVIARIVAAASGQPHADVAR